MKDLLIENGTVLQFGSKPAVLEGYGVLIEDGFIVKVAPSRVSGWLDR